MMELVDGFDVFFAGLDEEIFAHCGFDGEGGVGGQALYFHSTAISFIL